MNILRRPQTSKVSYNRSLNKTYNKDKENYQNDVCGQCNKPKGTFSKVYSKDDLSKTMGGFMPVESEINTDGQGQLKDQGYNSVGGEMKRTNLSNIEVDQLKNIITTNMKYYGEKTKVCCSVKPPKHKLTLPSKTGASIYKADYNKKPFDSGLAFKPSESYRPNYPFDPNTTYKSNFLPHKGELTSSSKPKYTPDDGPRFFNTQYKGQYLPWQAKNLDKFLPHDNILFQGGKFNPKTTYSGDFKGKPAQANPNLKDNKNSGIFKGFDMPKTTNYQNQYTKKPIAKQNNFMPKYNATPGMSHPGQYDTQYKNEFIPKQHKHCSYKRQFKDPTQMATMILNL